MTTNLLNRYVPLPVLNTAHDDFLLLSPILPAHKRGLAETYAKTISQATRRWHHFFSVVRCLDAGFKGEPDDLALRALAAYGHIFDHILNGRRRLGLANGAGGLLDQWAKDGLGKVAQLRVAVRQAVGDWGVSADGASEWLPSRAPVALLAPCLVARMPQRSYGKENIELHSPRAHDAYWRPPLFVVVQNR